MSTPGQPSKGKIAGLSLLGVAAVAGVIGVVTATTGGDTSQNAAQTSTSQTATAAPGGGAPAPAPASKSPAAPAPGGAASSSQAAPPAKPGAPTTKVVEAPVEQPAQQANQQPKSAGEAKSADVRVYNNGTVKGMANQAADRIRGDGYKVVQVGNYPNGKVPRTTVYFRPGTDEQATANSLAKDLGVRAEPRFSGIEKASPGVIVIITDDYKA
jgi:hypothetical protein